MDWTLADKVLKKTPLDLQKRSPIYHVCLKSHCCGSACELDTDVGSECPKHASALFSLSLDTVTVGEVDELEEDVGWINLLLWRCHWCWRGKTGGRIRWKVRNLDRNESVRTPFLMRCGFLIVDVGIPVFIAKLSERQNCWQSVFEDFHCQEYIQFFDVHRGLFMRLYFSIGGYDYCRTARFRQSIHFSGSAQSVLLH